MKYDFTTVLDRRGKDSIAVEPFASDWMTWSAKTKEGFDLSPYVGGGYEFPGGAYDSRRRSLKERTIPPMGISAQEKSILMRSSNGSG